MNEFLRNEWYYLKASGDIPSEIVDFMHQCFLIMEIRAKVGTVKGITFEIRTRESNHHVPHIHASYDKYSISIAIEDGSVLAGNLPKKQERYATNWVLEHKEHLYGKWKDVAFSASATMTQSRIGLLESQE